MNGETVGSRPGLVLLRVIGPIVVAGMIAFGVLAVITTFFRQSVQHTATLRGDVRQLVVRTDVGDIRLHPSSNAGTGKVSSTETWSFDRPKVSTSLENGVLTVTGRCSNRPISTGYCSVDLDITAPASAAVTVRSSTGDVSLNGLSGTIRATTSTGDITLQTTRSTNLTTTTSTGDVSIVLVTAPQQITARTSVGDITVVVPADGTAYRVDAATSTGTRTLRVPTDAAAARLLDLTTSTGDITLRTSGNSR